MIGKLVSGFGAIVITAMLARMLDPAELGAYFLNLTIAYFLGLAICLGIEQVIIRFISQSLVQGNVSDIRYYVLYALVIVSVTGVCVAGLLWSGLGHFVAQDIFKSVHLVKVIEYTAVLVLLQGLQKLIGEIFRGFENIAVATLFAGTVFGGSLSIALHIAAYAIMMWIVSDITLVAVVQVSAVICVFCVLFGLLLLKLTHPVSSAGKGHGVRILTMLKTGFPVFVINLSSMSTGYIDLWIVAALLNEEKVALYAAVTRLIKFMTTCLFMVNEFLSPIIAQLKLQHQNDQLEWALRTTAAIATMAGLPLFIVFVLFGEQTLTLFFGAYYAEASMVLAILSVAGMVGVVTGSSGQTLIMSGYSGILMWISLLTSAVTIGGSIVVAPPFGLLGVTWVLAAAGILHQVLMLVAARRSCHVWTHASIPLGVQATRTAVDLFANKLRGKSASNGQFRKL